MSLNGAYGGGKAGFGLGAKHPLNPRLSLGLSTACSDIHAFKRRAVSVSLRRELRESEHTERQSGKSNGRCLEVTSACNAKRRRTVRQQNEKPRSRDRTLQNRLTRQRTHADDSLSSVAAAYLPAAMAE